MNKQEGRTGVDPSSMGERPVHARGQECLGLSANSTSKLASAQACLMRALPGFPPIVRTGPSPHPTPLPAAGACCSPAHSFGIDKILKATPTAFPELDRGEVHNLSFHPAGQLLAAKPLHVHTCQSFLTDLQNPKGPRHSPTDPAPSIRWGSLPIPHHTPFFSSPCVRASFRSS